MKRQRLSWAPALALFVTGGPVAALNTTVIPDLSEDHVVRCLSGPASASRARYGLSDDRGQAMHLPSVIQMGGTAHRYAAVYTTPYPVTGGIRFRVNLAVSHDLMAWIHVGTLADNAGMAKLARVPGSSWLVLTHEQWQGRPVASTHPSRVAFKLFQSFEDLVSRRVRASYVLPPHFTNLNGTPSVYRLRLTEHEGRRSLNGEFGLHFWNGTRDVNAITSISRLFDPAGGTRARTTTLASYNRRFMAAGVSGNLGDRDTLATAFGRYNVQEGNLGKAASSWNKWRLFLYRFGPAETRPNGGGAIIPLAPRTPGGSVSFGNPTLNVVDRPAASGKALVVSYFLFHEGAAPGEAGSLLYTCDI